MDICRRLHCVRSLKPAPNTGMHCHTGMDSTCHVTTSVLLLHVLNTRPGHDNTAGMLISDLLVELFPEGDSKRLTQNDSSDGTKAYMLAMPVAHTRKLICMSLGEWNTAQVDSVLVWGIEREVPTVRFSAAHWMVARDAVTAA